MKETLKQRFFRVRYNTIIIDVPKKTRWQKCKMFMKDVIETLAIAFSFGL